jgi:hypothetical protein
MYLDLVLLLHLHLGSSISALAIQYLAAVTVPLSNSVRIHLSVRVVRGIVARLGRSGFRTILIDLPVTQVSSDPGRTSPTTCLTTTPRGAPATRI